MSEPGHDADGRADGAPVPLVIEEPDVSIADIGWTDVPALVLFWGLAVVVFLQFFTRYALNNSLAWTEEVARYLLILVCFLGSVGVVRRGGHIALEFVLRMVKPAHAKLLAVTAELITLGLYASLTWVGLGLIQRTRQKLVTVPIPRAWIYAVCVAALAAMTVHSAIWLWRKLRRRPEDLVADLDAHLTTD